MGGSGTADDKAILQHHKASPLCWVARLLALGYGLLTALYALGVFIAASIAGGVSRGEVGEWVLGFLFILLWAIPLALAIIAWRWHLLGGGLIVVGSMALYVVFSHASSITWGTHLYMLPLVGAGLLHIAAWHVEKKAHQLPPLA
ncbi:MAG: hypothetical protein QUS33_01070 [Dehalococcoidia bacterium]|nr:hypothetical protein [Dehalococcoidia bacterium]